MEVGRINKSQCLPPPGLGSSGSNWQSQDLPGLAMRKRSAALAADPKAQELRHFVGSRLHETRLKEAAGIAESELDKSAMDHQIKVLREVQQEFDGEEKYEFGSCGARLEWRNEMDRRVKRLFQESELALDDRFKDADKARMRCDHLDRMYDWYEKHGGKEAVKERPAPAFLRFDASAPVMAGSLRSHPVEGKSAHHLPPIITTKSSSVLRASLTRTMTPSPALKAAATQSVAQLAPVTTQRTHESDLQSPRQPVPKWIPY